MLKQGKFMLMSKAEFKDWLTKTKFTRTIELIQQHHTYVPNYKTIVGQDKFKTLNAIEKSHLDRGFDQIAQNLTLFPDGTIAICRDFNIAPAGIKGANSHGICIENIGNFDTGGDSMTATHKDLIIFVNADLCIKYKLTPSINSIVYHHWYDLNSGERINDKSAGHETKTCPGTNWFGGNTTAAAQKNFIPLIVKEIAELKKGYTIEKK